MFRNSITEFIQNKNVLMFVTAIFFMAGILSFFNDCFLFVALVLTLLLCILVINKWLPYKYVLLWGIIFYLGFLNASLRIKNEDGVSHFAPADAVIIGRVVSIPNSNVTDKTKFFFEVTNIGEDKVVGKTLVSLHSEDGIFKDLNVGNIYKINGKLRSPFSAGNPSQFDYGKYLRNFKTYTVFYAESSDCIQLDSQLSVKWKFLQGLNNVRNNIIATHAKYLKSPNLEILGGIVFGDDAVAPPDYIKDTFKNSGLLHILAASGMNVAFIYGFWYFILRRLRVPYKITVITGMGIIVLYTLMTGLGASVIRAALMLLFVLAGKLIDRDAHSVSLLAFVASLMLVYNPAFINDVGFQLSFIVTFGLLTTANAVMARLDKCKIPNWLSAEILIPIVAQIWVAPIQMFYFNSFSTYSVFANISIMPFLSVISFGGFVGSVLAMIPIVGNWICMIFDFVLRYFLNVLVWISKFFSDLPYSLINTTHPSIIQILLFYFIVLVVTYMFKNRFTKRKLVVAGVLILLLGISIVPVKNNNLEILSFDVQNADAFLIKTPKNKYFIIDTGKSAYNNGSSQAKVIILKYLKDNGIKNIEGMIITHFDNDHSGGAVDLLEELNVKNVYINSSDNRSFTSKNIYETLRAKSINTFVAKNNDLIYEEKGLTIKTYRAYKNSDNENSVITLVSKGKFDSLFMGDAGVEAYEAIKSDLRLNNLDVFKVGHHGGKNVVSKEMVSELQPKVSLISTGQNKFGHPNKITLDTLRTSDIYRTDKNNAIKISVHGDGFKVLTYDKSSRRFRLFKAYVSD